MKNNFKRCLALLLALMTIVGAFSIPVSAAEECDHDWKVYGEPVKSTCTAQGYTTEFCAKCQDYRITDVQPKLAHEHQAATKEVLPTCSKWGYFVGALVCPNCGDIDDTNWTQEQKDKYKPVSTLPATEDEVKKDKYHKWGDPTFEGEPCVGATYVIKYTCSECKQTISFDKTGSGAHDYEYTNRVNPTCQTEGSVVRTCKNCLDKVTLKIEKSAHTFDGKNVKYDFVKVGSDAKAQHQSYENCTVCGEKGNKGTKVTHDFSNDSIWDTTKTVVVPSTCAALGSTTKTCKDCGYEKTVKATSQPNHTYNAAIIVSRVEAKHDAAGRVHAYTEHNCTTCGNNFKLYDGWNETTGGNGNMRWVPKNLNDHDWTKASEVSSTCFVAGATRYTCTCGAEKNVAIAAAHVWVKDPSDATKDYVITVPPTCSDKGYDYKTCQYCGHIEKSNPKNPLKSDGTHKTTTEDKTKEGYVKESCLYNGQIPLWCSDCNAIAGYKTVAKVTAHKASTAKVTYEGTGCFDNKYKITTCTKGCTLADGTTAAFTKELVIENQNSHNFAKNVVVKEATCYSVGINGKECDRCKTVIETEFTSFSDNHTGVQVYSVNAETYWNGTGLNISNPHPNYATTGETWKAVDFTKYSCVEPVYEWWYCNACHRNYRAPMKAQVETQTKTGNFYIESTKKYVTEVTLKPVSGSHTIYIEVNKAASCFATGEATKKCAMCDLSETIVLPKIAHSILKSTTEKDDNGKFVDLKIEVNATYDNLGTVTGATCTNAYNWKKWCTTCNSYVEFGTDAALGHKMPDKWESTAAPAVAPTCVNGGTARRDCERFASCGYYETKPLNATGKHSGTQVAGTGIPATCTKDGVEAIYDCDTCDNLFKKVYKNNDPSKEVTSTPVVKEPAVIPALGHQKYEDAIKSYKKNNVTAQHDIFKGTPVASTCTSVGYTPILCKTCQKVEIGQTDYMPMTAHNYILANNDGKIDETDYDPANVVEATCQDYWYKYIACSTCDGHFYKITDDSKPKKPHVNANGDTLTGSCLLELDDYNCVNGTTAHKVEPTHNWTEKYSAACHGTSKYCDVCKKWEFVVDADKKAAHTFPADTADYIEYVAPTMTTKGYEEKACIVCGFVQAKELDKLPAVTFSLEAVNANDVAAVIVNGGKIYVNIKMDAEDVAVNGIKLSVKYDENVLTLLKKESAAIPSVFGAFSNTSNQPVVSAIGGVVTIYDEAGSIRENVAIGDADLFATLVFQVNPSAYAKKDYVTTALSFYTGYDVAENPYKSQVTTKTADGYADNNFAYGDEIEVKIKQLGDYNNDGLVDSKDVSAVADLAVLNFTEKKYDAVLDIDHDGDIDFDDYKYIKLFQVPGSYKSDEEFYDVAIYEARLAEEAKKAEEANK